jgi:hypothetical protein
MAIKKEKILTQEQMEDIVLFVYNMVKDGYSMNYIKERTIDIENDNHKCRIVTTMFRDNKEISLINIKNNITNKEISLSLNDHKDRSNILKKLEFLQSKVNDIIEENKPIYYSNDEIEDIIGDPSLLGKRSVKVDHLVDNIKLKKKNRFSFKR